MAERVRAQEASLQSLQSPAAANGLKSGAAQKQNNAVTNADARIDRRADAAAAIRTVGAVGAEAGLVGRQEHGGTAVEEGVESLRPVSCREGLVGLMGGWVGGWVDVWGWWRGACVRI